MMDKYKKAFDNMRVSPEVLERAKQEASKAAATPEDKPGGGEAGIGFTAAGDSNKARSIRSAGNGNRKRNLWTLGAAAACFAVVIGVWATGGLPALNTPVSEEINTIKSILSVEDEPEEVFVGISDNGEAVVKTVDHGTPGASEGRTKTGNPGESGTDAGNAQTVGSKDRSDGAKSTGSGTGSGDKSAVSQNFSGSAGLYGTSAGTSEEGSNSADPQEGDGVTSQVFSDDGSGTAGGGSQGDTAGQEPESTEGPPVMTAQPGGTHGVAAGNTVAEGQAGTCPLQDLKTVEDVEAALGYKIKTPSGYPSGYSVECVNLIGGNLVSITYVKGSVRVEYRYEKASADISGDYTNYSYITDLVTGTKKFVLKGNSENDIRNITCIGSSESCSYLFDTPVTMVTAMKWISALN